MNHGLKKYKVVFRFDTLEKSYSQIIHVSPEFRADPVFDSWIRSIALDIVGRDIPCQYELIEIVEEPSPEK